MCYTDFKWHLKDLGNIQIERRKVPWELFRFSVEFWLWCVEMIRVVTMINWQFNVWSCPGDSPITRLDWTVSPANTQHSTFNPQHSNFNTQHLTLNTQTSTLNTKPLTLNFEHEHSTCNTHILHSRLSTLSTLSYLDNLMVEAWYL